MDVKDQKLTEYHDRKNYKANEDVLLSETNELSSFAQIQLIEKKVFIIQLVLYYYLICGIRPTLFFKQQFILNLLVMNWRDPFFEEKRLLLYFFYRISLIIFGIYEKKFIIIKFQE